MSQPVRRVVAALGLMAALLLAAPPPSRATGLPAGHGFARTWVWLEGLWPGTPPAASASRRHVRAKTQEAVAGLSSLATPVPPPSGTSDEGSAIDPNGHK